MLPLNTHLSILPWNRTSISAYCCFLLGVVLFACETVTKKEQLQKEFNQNDTLLISVSTASGWLLDVYAAGDGVLKYRTKARDSYYLAENTFKFDSLKRKLVQGLNRVNFQQPPPLGVRIITSQYPKGFFYALQDEAFAEDLFKTAFRASMQDLAEDRRSTRLRRTYRFHPPVPRE
ncbi:MAG: hypothetical protein HRU41_13535 [Saprospiraceae bacterium]|nr:hypothetical protein [Saprospiraceae bacterium]